MSVLDSILNIFAPHTCIGCGSEGAVLCLGCITALPVIPERCYRCHKLAEFGRTCPSCRSVSRINRARAVTPYAGAAREAVRRLKYDGAQAAAKDMAAAMTPLLLTLPTDVAGGPVIVPVPTTTSRRRERGYDQASLLARQLGIRTGLSWREMLHRSGNLHQVGASRAARLHQLGDDVFRVRATAYVEGCHVILIDDVMTTGGTVEAAAKVLRAAGARQVDVMVFAVA